jgi:peroxiredoxin
LKPKDLLILSAGLLVGVGLAILIFYGLEFGRQDEVNKLESPIPGVTLIGSAAVDSLAPDFELYNLDGETVKLSDLQGKIVLINFWATWCEPCKVEMPLFEERYQLAGSDLEILAVNFDEPEAEVRQFVDEFELSFPVLLDPGGTVQNLYRVRGYPTTFIVDEDGIIQYHHIGLFTEGQLDQYLTQLGVLE